MKKNLKRDVYVYIYILYIKYIIYIELNYFVVHLRLTQHCKLIILQKMTQKRKKEFAFSKKGKQN